MTKNKSTKRTLLMSVLSLILCVSMLVGTTFAWFTDSVTSGANKIVAGNLDVELYHTNGTDTDEAVSDTTPLFDEVTLWEPGAMVWEKLTVKNVGSLALKYTLSVNIDDIADVDGKSLADVLKVAVMNEQPTRENIVTAATQSLKTIALQSDGVLAAQTGVDEFYVAIYWAPSASDNDYNIAGEALYANLGVTLLATQATVESDTFDDQYDKDATYSDVTIPADAVKVGTFQELSEALVTGGNIALVGDIEVTSSLDIAKDTDLYAVEGTNLSFASTAQMKVKDGATFKLVNVTVDNNDTFGFDADGKFQITDVAGRNTVAIFDVSAGSHLIIEKYTTISNVVGRNQAVVMANGTADNRATVTVKGTITDCAGTTGGVICANKCTDVYIEDGAVLKNNVSYNSHNYGLIKIYDGSMFYMNGGEITNNLYAGNGLIGFQSGDAVINGGIIHNNNFYDGKDSMIDSGNAINSRHGLIYAHSYSEFTINGGEIINNTVTFYGALDCGRNDSTTTVTLIVNGGTIKNNLSSDGFDEFGPMIYDYFGTIASEEYVTISKNADVSGLIFDFNDDYKFVTDLAK